MTKIHFKNIQYESFEKLKSALILSHFRFLITLYNMADSKRVHLYKREHILMSQMKSEILPGDLAKPHQISFFCKAFLEYIANFNGSRCIVPDRVR